MLLRALITPESGIGSSNSLLSEAFMTPAIGSAVDAGAGISPGGATGSSSPPQPVLQASLEHRKL